MEKQNRAERRRDKFGGGRATAHGGWPTVQPNPAFETEPETGGAEAPVTEAKPKRTAAKATPKDAATSATSDDDTAADV